TISNAKLRLAVERYGGHNFVICGINHGGILAASVEGEDTLGAGIVENGVWVFAFNLDSVSFLEGLEIKNRDRILAPIAGESFIQILRQGNAVYTRSVGDFCNDRSFIRVHHHDPG